MTGSTVISDDTHKGLVLKITTKRVSVKLNGVTIISCRQPTHGVNSSQVDDLYKLSVSKQVVTCTIHEATHTRGNVVGVHSTNKETLPSTGLLGDFPMLNFLLVVVWIIAGLSILNSATNSDVDREILVFESFWNTMRDIVTFIFRAEYPNVGKPDPPPPPRGDPGCPNGVDGVDAMPAGPAGIYGVDLVEMNMVEIMGYNTIGSRLVRLDDSTKLHNASILEHNEQICSTSGAYCLRMWYNKAVCTMKIVSGEAVVKPFIYSSTKGCNLKMQNDRNLVLYRTRNIDVLWASETDGDYDVSYLTITNSGRLFLMSDKDEPVKEVIHLLTAKIEPEDMNRRGVLTHGSSYIKK